MGLHSSIGGFYGFFGGRDTIDGDSGDDLITGDQLVAP